MERSGVTVCTVGEQMERTNFTVHTEVELV
jgi:hypothetical protein